jgi:hypothetical protein
MTGLRPGPFSDSGAIYLLEFESEYKSLAPKPINRYHGAPKYGWKSELSGVLELSDRVSRRPRRLFLCAGLERSTLKLLDTPLLCCRPWCLVYECEDPAMNESCDGVFKDASQFSQWTHIQATSRPFGLRFGTASPAISSSSPKQS